MDTLQIRVDKKTKTSAKKVLNKLGLDMSSAIKLYLKQITLQKGIPFPLLTENGLTYKQEEEILQASKEVKEGKNASPALEVKKFLQYLDEI